MKDTVVVSSTLKRRCSRYYHTCAGHAGRWLCHGSGPCLDPTLAITGGVPSPREDRVATKTGLQVGLIPAAGAVDRHGVARWKGDARPPLCKLGASRWRQVYPTQSHLQLDAFICRVVAAALISDPIPSPYGAPIVAARALRDDLVLLHHAVDRNCRLSETLKIFGAVVPAETMKTWCKFFANGHKVSETRQQNVQGSSKEF